MRELSIGIVTTFHLQASVVCICIRLTRIDAMSQGTANVRYHQFTVDYVVYFLLGNSLASEFYMSTFRNTLSVPSS
jgi:hypothetical protein